MQPIHVPCLSGMQSVIVTFENLFESVSCADRKIGVILGLLPSQGELGNVQRLLGHNLCLLRNSRSGLNVSCSG